MPEFTVPLVDPETGDGHDVTVEAPDATAAVQQVDLDGYHLAFPFVEEHFDVDRDAAFEAGAVGEE